MGLIITAVCGICAFEVKFVFGSGKMNYSTELSVPAINLTTRKFENVNFIDPALNRDDYAFYHDKQLKGNNLDYQTYTWRNLELHQVYNYCPNCQKFHFHFKKNPIFMD